MNAIYARISRMCEESKISINKMCADIGIHSGSMCDLKHGRKKAISIKTAKKISDYFNVPIEEIMYGEAGKESENYYAIFPDQKKYGEENANSAIGYLIDIKSNEEIRTLIDAASGASEEEIRMSRRLLEYLKSLDVSYSSDTYQGVDGEDDYT